MAAEAMNKNDMPSESASRLRQLDQLRHLPLAKSQK
jgi:hypothetical protein